ncbi:hypothetical protein COLO4_32089 [Corchorus olitorius]|uniref:Uncharacterized protein n=1 Tax=Corchorus olitorius TaxID=93759 RepID=A0A1R3H1Z7_9ROSI|nr:hypothetical protein COLO4_32089 [Corchorus olitorius]
MVRSFKAQTMEVLPAGWLQTLGFRSVPFPRPIPRFNSSVWRGRWESKDSCVQLCGKVHSLNPFVCTCGGEME